MKKLMKKLMKNFGSVKIELEIVLSEKNIAYSQE